MNQIYDKPTVSVLCITYNHEEYIRSTLESFVMQKTSFPFEVIIHDDASTDGTASIIEEYVNKYPHIFVSICQKENQYKKGIIPTVDILLPRARGRYIALCEGDDYWCDEHKLQRQFEYMELHAECSMCVHNTKKHYLNKNVKDDLFNKWTTIHKMSEEEIFMEWKVHTSSYFMRIECMYRPEFARIWAGDYVMLTMAFYMGEIVSLPYVMSVYNANNMGGITYKNNNSGIDVVISRLNSRIKYLEEYNKYTKERYDNTVNKEISRLKLECQLMKFDSLLIKAKTYKEMKVIAKSINDDELYNMYFNNFTMKRKVKSLIKYKGYVLGGLWTAFWHLYYKM